MSPPLPQNEEPSSVQQQSLALWLIGFIVRLQARFNIPDSAIGRLLLFLCTFFQVLGHFSSFIAGLARRLPSSLYRLRKTLKVDNQVTKYIVCPKCEQLYHRGSCVRRIGTKEESLTCHYSEFPNHPHHARRQCGQLMLKSVHLPSGKTVLYPFKIYCYRSIQSYLEHFLLRTGFIENCDHWKNRKSTGMLQDVYDGRIWQQFMQVLTTSTCLALMLNVDWFQPYTHTCCSVGVVFLTIMNLPRSLRYKRHNVLLVGVIPGPSEPIHDINPYLQPLVNELLVFWKGVQMKVQRGSNMVIEQIRCALLCVTCDTPAGRKVCGFLGHTARLGCFKCLKSFPGSVGTMNFSGFDRSTWHPRSVASHRQNIEIIQQCQTKTARAAKESQLGCRYSVLMKLPYFDPIKMLVIDPMHNLFLGTGKHMVNLWLQLDLVTKQEFQSLQRTVDAMVVPSDVGRVPRKIETGFSGFTADQFKNWITVYSIPALHGLLPSEHLECWRHFVLACRILCQNSLSFDDVTLADALLLAFCRRVERMYGESAITPNMHLHGHLREVLKEYGPVQEFWLFSYERYNGILGHQPSNNKLIEPQLMKRFLQDNLAYSFSFPSEFEQDFTSVCHFHDQRICGSTLSTISPAPDEPYTYHVPTRSTRGILCTGDQTLISLLYQRLHHTTCHVSVNSIIHKYSSIEIRGKRYNTGRQSIALVKWDNDLFLDQPTIFEESLHHHNSNCRPVKIHYFAKVSFCIGDHTSNCDSMLLAVVSWYFPHTCRHVLGKPVEVWNPSMYEAHGVYCFVPIHLLVARCAYCVKVVESESVLLVVPLVE